MRPLPVSRLILVFLVLLMGTLALLSGCAQGGSMTASNESFLSQDPLLSLVDNLRLSSVSCDSPTCSPSVGFVLSLNEKPSGVGQCTGFLVAPNIIATNAHCIPESLRFPLAPCGSKVGIKFPGFDRYSEESRVCDRILAISSVNPEFTRPDLAFFTIKKASRRPTMRLSRQGIPEGSLLSIDSMNPMADKGVPMGKLVRRTCLSHKQSRRLADDFDAYSLVTMLFEPKVADCEVVKGNSGSPVSNGKGVAFGVIHAITVDEDGYLPKFDPVTETEQQVLGVYTTNFACLPASPRVAALGRPNSNVCDERARLRAAGLAKQGVPGLANEQANASLKKLHVDWLKTAPAGLIYRSNIKFADQAAVEFVPNPICLLKSGPRPPWKIPTFTATLFRKRDRFQRATWTYEVQARGQVSRPANLPPCAEEQIAAGSIFEGAAIVNTAETTVK